LLEIAAAGSFHQRFSFGQYQSHSRIPQSLLPICFQLGVGDHDRRQQPEAVAVEPRADQQKPTGERPRSLRHRALERDNADHFAVAIEHRKPFVPGPPEFRLDFAGSLLQVAMMDQAEIGDRIVLIETKFRVEGIDDDWSLVFVPNSGGLEALGVGVGTESPPAGPGPIGDDPGRLP